MRPKPPGYHPGRMRLSSALGRDLRGLAPGSAVALAVWLAARQFAATEVDAAFRAETAYLGSLAAWVLAAVAWAAPRPALEIGAGATLAVTALWTLPGGPTRAATVATLLVAVFVAAAWRGVAAAPAALDGFSWLRRVLHHASLFVPLAVGAQVLLRGRLLIEAAGDLRALAAFWLSAVLAGLAAAVLAARWGAQPAAAIAAAVALFAPGFSRTAMLCLVGIAALGEVAARLRPQAARLAPVAPAGRRAGTALALALGTLFAATALLASPPWLRREPLADALALAAVPRHGLVLVDGQPVTLDAAHPDRRVLLQPTPVSELVFDTHLTHAAALAAGTPLARFEPRTKPGAATASCWRPAATRASGPRYGRTCWQARGPPRPAPRRLPPGVRSSIPPVASSRRPTARAGASAVGSGPSSSRWRETRRCRRRPRSSSTARSFGLEEALARRRPGAAAHGRGPRRLGAVAAGTARKERRARRHAGGAAAGRCRSLRDRARRPIPRGVGLRRPACSAPAHRGRGRPRGVGARRAGAAALRARRSRRAPDGRLRLPAGRLDRCAAPGAPAAPRPEPAGAAFVALPGAAVRRLSRPAAVVDQAAAAGRRRALLPAHHPQPGLRPRRRPHQQLRRRGLAPLPGAAARAAAGRPGGAERASSTRGTTSCCRWCWRRPTGCGKPRGRPAHHGGAHRGARLDDAAPRRATTRPSGRARCSPPTRSRPSRRRCCSTPTRSGSRCRRRCSR